MDLWPLYLFHPDAVTVNAAIDRYVRVRVAPSIGRVIRLTDRNTGRSVAWKTAGKPPASGRYELFAQGLRHFRMARGMHIEFRSDVPKGAGLAGSSALLVAFCGALMKIGKQGIRKDRFLALVRDIETRLIRVPAGMQDYYPAVWGGVQAIWWRPGEVLREELRVVTQELEERLLLVYTGTSRKSGANNWEVFKRHLDGDRSVRRLFHMIVEAARGTVAALKAGDFGGLGKQMALEAKARKRLFPGIMTPQIDSLERSLGRLGAIATKVCGAGGGGCVVVALHPEARSRVTEKVREMGFQDLPFQIVPKGLSFRKMAVAKPVRREGFPGWRMG